jgi:hypothetical protein
MDRDTARPSRLCNFRGFHDFPLFTAFTTFTRPSAKYLVVMVHIFLYECKFLVAGQDNMYFRIFFFWAPGVGVEVLTFKVSRSTAALLAIVSGNQNRSTSTLNHCSCFCDIGPIANPKCIHAQHPTMSPRPAIIKVSPSASRATCTSRTRIRSHKGRSNSMTSRLPTPHISFQIAN